MRENNSKITAKFTSIKALITGKTIVLISIYITLMKLSSGVNCLNTQELCHRLGPQDKPEYENTNKENVADSCNTL